MNEEQRKWMASNIDVVEVFRSMIETKVNHGEKVVMGDIAKVVRQSFQELNPGAQKRGGRTPAWLAGELAREHLARFPENAKFFSGRIANSVYEVQENSPQRKMTAALLELEMRIDEMEKAINYLADPIKPWWKRIFN